MLPNSSSAKRRAAWAVSSKRYDEVWKIGTARDLVDGSPSWPPCKAMVSKFGIGVSPFEVSSGELRRAIARRSKATVLQRFGDVGKIGDDGGSGCRPARPQPADDDRAGVTS